MTHITASVSNLPDSVCGAAYTRTDDNMILERSTGKKYWNTDITLIEERLWKNMYWTPKQFLRDIEQIVHDAKEENDRERYIKVNL